MIVRKDEGFPERPVIIVLYGTAGVGKTSMFNTCNNPILIDCDRGADRAINRQDTIIAKNWKEVIQDQAELKNYLTVGIDTAKAVLDDYLMIHVTEVDYTLKKNKLKAYGAIGDEFKLFINSLRSNGSDIVIIAHAKQEQDGDLMKQSPDVTGQSKDLILRIADQVGFVRMENNHRTLSFDPTDKTIGKNVARIAPQEVPDESDPRFNTFMADIIEKVKKSIRTQSEDQIKSQEMILELSDELAKCTDSDNLMAFSAQCSTAPESVKAGMRKAIADKVTKLGLRFDKTENKFVPNVEI